MKIIFIGDIVGKTARDKVIKVLPDLKTLILLYKILHHLHSFQLIHTI